VHILILYSRMTSLYTWRLDEVQTKLLEDRDINVSVASIQRAISCLDISWKSVSKEARERRWSEMTCLGQYGRGIWLSMMTPICFFSSMKAQSII